MQILILGDNTNAMSVGQALAATHDVRLIGNNRDRLAHIEKSVDCQIIHHNPLNQEGWRQAQIQDCDVLIAMTDSEESNILACQIISQLHALQLVICAVSNELHPFRAQLFPHSNTTQYIVLSTANLIANKLEQILLHHHCEEVITASNNRFCCLKVKLTNQSPLIGQKTSDFEENLPQGANIAALIREDQCQNIDNKTTFCTNDVLLLAQPQTLSNNLLNQITAHTDTYKRIMIAGNGDTTLALLNSIQHSYMITVIIEDLQHAQSIASSFPGVIVLHGSINDNDLLKDENIGDYDVFIALSKDDENNLTSALQAKNYGTKFVVTLINQPGLIPVIEHTPIDSIISPQNTLSDHIYQHTHPGAIQSISHLDHNHGVVVEIILPSHLNNTKFNQWNLSPHCQCIGLINQETVLSIQRDRTFTTNDHFHIYVPDNKELDKLQALLAKS